MNATAGRDRLAQLIEPLVIEAGFDLEGITLTSAGRRRMLRVIVDRDGGVGVDDLAELNRTVSAALDGSDAMGRSPYVLELTSPGVDRPLTEPRHWRRASGRLVRVRLRDGGQVTGRVVDPSDEGVSLEIGGARRRFTYDELGRGTVQVEFGASTGERH